MAKIVLKKNKNKKQFYSMDGFSRKEKRKKTALYVLLIAVIIILVAAIVYIAYTLIGGNENPSASNQPTNTAIPGTTPTVKAMTDDEGRVFNRVTFFGENGQTLLISNIIIEMDGKTYETKEINKELSILDGSTFFDLYNDDYVPQEPTGPVRVVINPWIRKKDGTETPSPSAYVNIDVEYAELRLYTPKNDEINEEGFINTYKNEYTVRFTTSTNSKVYINGEDKTADRNKAGLIVYNMSLNPGQNDLKIKVVEPKRMPLEKTVTFIQPERPVSLEITQMPKETNTDSISIIGKTEPGCTISTDQIQEGPANVDSNGNFTLKLRLKNRGHNSVWIFAENSDGERTVLEYNVHYKVDINEYSRSAWKLESSVLVYPDSYENKTYKLDQVYIEEIVDLYPTIAKGRITLDGIDYSLYLKYTGEFMFEVGATYSIFADVAGSYEGSPLFIIFEGYGFIN